ncbi:methyltransferase domain-containing protein [Streptomyces sp. NBC_01808]|uniref:methyltransferase domain-containing protein n=1 Tax=Streptomyces sp. NBC_01808 TaxID=2975947 RepID=UPI002DD9424D|nr:methyltransferase domain-containing protein [Streptomyces sp. NBC_01808]WSA38909.1 methyltransferase domain-containing protein [Streptomyces sp. NBC_01808]
MRDDAHFVARSARGLEPQLAAEILQRELGSITAVGHRSVHFRAWRPYDTGVTGLRTADDVFLLAARGRDVGTRKSGVPGLTELASKTDSARLIQHRNTLLGNTVKPPGLEVSASFLGRRSFNRYDVEDAVGNALAARLKVPYHPRRTKGAPPPDYASWRLTLDGTEATLMLRITPRPLHRRPYKQATVRGTLHPPLAAAMTRLADIGRGHTVLDPCCGAGTVLIEAALAHPEAGQYRGYDIDETALKAASANKRMAAAVRIHLERADAGRLPLPDGTVDRIVCNPPWGTQVEAKARMAKAPAAWWRELHRLLTPTGTAVLLLPTPTPLLPALQAGLLPTHTQRIHLSGTPTYLIKLEPGNPR